MASFSFILTIFAALYFITSFIYMLIRLLSRKRHGSFIQRRRHLGCIIILFFLLSFSILLLAYNSGYLVLLGTRPSSTIAHTEIAGLRISMASYTNFFRVDQSATIHVFIASNTSGTSSTTHATSGVLSTELTPVGTVGVPIEHAFGPGYHAFATAQLSASSFDVDPTQQTQQSLDQGEVHFAWTITPKYSGQQQLYVTVTGIWVPQNGGPSIIRPLGSVPGTILVESLLGENPFFTVGQSLLLVLLGSALNIPWIWDLIVKRRKEQRGTKLESMSQPGFAPQPSNSPSQGLHLSYPLHQPPWPPSQSPGDYSDQSQDSQGQYGSHLSRPSSTQPPAHPKKSNKNHH